MLEGGQGDTLERLAAQIMLPAGARFNRAELIQAMIDAVLESGIDLTQMASEEALRDMLKQRLA